MLRGALVGLGVFGAFAICGTAWADDLPIVTAIRSADAACDAQHFSTHAEFGNCYNAGEREAWATYAPAALPSFDRYAAARQDVDERIDADLLTNESGTAEIKNDGAAFLAELQQLVAAGANQRQQRAQRAEQVQEGIHDALVGIAAYYQGRATAAAAQPRTTHTICNWIGATETCTNTPY
jgi:hypothetical protein